MQKINRLKLESEALEKNLTKEQVKLLRFNKKPPYTLEDLNILKVRRNLIATIRENGWSLRSIALIANISDSRIYQIIEKYEKRKI